MIEQEGGQQFVTGDRPEDQLIVRVKIENHQAIPVRIASRFACLFHGDTVIPYGRYNYRYPIKNVGKQRLLTEFELLYKGVFKIDFTSQGVERV